VYVFFGLIYFKFIEVLDFSVNIFYQICVLFIVLFVCQTN
jgi:hypothetical protein